MPSITVTIVERMPQLFVIWILVMILLCEGVNDVVVNDDAQKVKELLKVVDFHGSYNSMFVLDV